MLLLNVAALLHVQLKGVHSPLMLQAVPGGFGPGGPASGRVVGVPAHPPRLVHSAGHTALALLHAPPEQGEAATGFLPSLHAQTMGAQSTADLHVQPPWLAHDFGQACSGAVEQ